MRFILLCCAWFFATTGFAFPLSSPSAKSSLAERSENTAVILVHGWGRSPRVPWSTWASIVRPYTDLTNLHKHYHDLGFQNIHEVVYDDLASMDEIVASVASQIQRIVAYSRNPNLTLDIVGHSLGHYVSTHAILDERFADVAGHRLADRVRVFIGLAGIVRGQDELYPCHWFPDQCGGADVLEPYYVGPGQGSPVIDRLFKDNFAALDKLRKCSIYSKADEIVKSPYNSASFVGIGLNPDHITEMEIDFHGVKFHKEVKDSKVIFDQMIEGCYRGL